MVKGISKQVIVLRPQDPKLYEQAIFILREDAVGITDDMLLHEAMQLSGKRSGKLPGIVWAGFGAAAVALIWVLTALF